VALAANPSTVKSGATC
jgi:hypothetical protein